MRKQKFPNLFLVGAPRCGTTTLHELLHEHPDIFMSKIKEPHYFSSIEFPALEKKVLYITESRNKYLNLFKNAHDYQICGESSTYYLSDQSSPELIKRLVDNPKIIAILRDPIERAYSHYLLLNRRGEQKHSFLEVIENLKQSDEINPVYNILELGNYHKHISNYLKFIDKKNIHIIFFEELKNDPEKVLSEISVFLGIRNFNKNTDNSPNSNRNSYKSPRNRFSNWLLGNTLIRKLFLKIIPRKLLRIVRNKVLLKSNTKPPISPDAQKCLMNYYYSEISKLEELLDVDCTYLRKSWPNKQS